MRGADTTPELNALWRVQFHPLRYSPTLSNYDALRLYGWWIVTNS